MNISDLNLGPTTQVELNWQAYFYAFNELHGGNPVEFEGRLLWQDGFTHGKNDYKGPEWPPPQDPRELLRLKAAYWTRRRKIVDDQRIQLKTEIEHLRLVQNRRSAPLQQTVFIRNEEAAAGEPLYRCENRDLDLVTMLERLKWLTEDVILCDENLNNLVPRTQEQRTGT